MALLTLSGSSARKQRLDALLFQKGLAGSRHHAQALILSGKVRVDGSLQTKSGTRILESCRLEVEAPFPYVGRGGLKLEKALREFGLDVRGKMCLDIGASTGGFTDCLLQHGAKKVYAVDVGRGQLALALRKNPRVICMERTNARSLSTDQIPEEIELCVIDVSFISVRKILPAAALLAAGGGDFVVLLKPQFEAGPRHAKKGIVRDPKIHEEVLIRFLEWALENRFYPRGAVSSPVTGVRGNIEFLVRLGLSPPVEGLDVPALVQKAHEDLRKSS